MNLKIFNICFDTVNILIEIILSVIQFIPHVIDISIRIKVTSNQFSINPNKEKFQK